MFRKTIPALALLLFFLPALSSIYSQDASESPTDQTAAAATSSESNSDGVPPAVEASEAAPLSGGEISSGVDTYPYIVLAVGIATVLGLIIGFKINAFLSLIIAALVVSLMVGGNPGDRLEAVTAAFGSSAGKVGIVIAMAAIIGKCMLDSGAADRIVRKAVGITGERHASAGLMASGFILAVPVFFDTVFYLLVPLARSLYRRTNKNYLRYLMAIATGGAITHTLVPPTPGPLLVAATLGVDIGMMMFVGTMVAIPAAIVGLLFSVAMDALTPIPMRPLGPGSEKHEPLPDEKLPSLFVSFLPVLLPLVLIGIGTAATTLADREDRARLAVEDVRDFAALGDQLRSGLDAETETPASRFINSPAWSDDAKELLLAGQPLSDDEKESVIESLNQVLLSRGIYDEKAFFDVGLSGTAKSMAKSESISTKPVDRRRMNRLLLEESFPGVIEPHNWSTSTRRFADSTRLWSNASFALLLAALVSIWILKSVRGLSLRETGHEVEESLMSGGVIILITAAGGAFGAMLSDAQIGDAIKASFSEASAGGVGLLLLAYAIAAVLKIAQGSSTVAMIVTAGMIGAISSGVTTGYHPAYLGTAIGAGSLFGSWMNDSGFWVFAKMGGLTEGESLRSWTLLLLVLSLTALGTTVLLSQLLPMVG